MAGPGFQWDLGRKVVISPSKCAKYLARLETWSEDGLVTRADCGSVISCLQHCCLVLRDGRAFLPSFRHFQASFKSPSSPLLKHRIPSNVLSDVVWWRSQLSAVECIRVIRPVPPPLPLQVFVDASTSFGIGFLANGCWLCWRLLPGWKSDGRDIGWAEMVAVDLGLRALIHYGLRDVHIRLCSDNKGVVDAIRAGCSRNLAQNHILRTLLAFTHDHGIWFSVEWVKSADNLSDGISRGIFPHSKSRFSCHPPLPEYLEPFVKLV